MTRVDPRQSNYSLTEASDRLNVSEEVLLEAAASGSIDLYVNTVGLKGHWRRGIADRGSKTSSAQTLSAGYLALTSESCKEMANYGNADASVLEFRRSSENKSVERDRDIKAAPRSRKVCEIHFCLFRPLSVDRGMIVLLPPLPFFAV